MNHRISSSFSLKTNNNQLMSPPIPNNNLDKTHHHPKPKSLPDLFFTALPLLFLFSSSKPQHHFLKIAPLSFPPNPPRLFLKNPIMSQTKRNPSYLSTPQSLSEWLKPRLPSDSFASWGVKPGTKNVHNLWLEISEGETSLVDSTPPIRTVHVATIRIIGYDDRILIESHQELSDGTIRARCRPLSEKMKPGERVEDAVIRAVKEELGSIIRWSWDEGDGGGNVRIVPGSYLRKVEERVSVSYPGLPVCYVLHSVEAWVDGLPEGEFCTEEEEYGTHSKTKIAEKASKTSLRNPETVKPIFNFSFFLDFLMAEGGGERELGKAANAMDSSEIVNTEDVVQALMDYLVDPVLPGKSSARDNPSLSQHQSVAKQMHAVVLLYNYYHRRQFPQLEFLDFESFCKVAVIAKPTLLVHMKFMQGCNDEVDDLDKQLSITEKVIMDACNICVALDASKDVPSTEGWTVSKVTVFLIDSMQKNCLLLFSSITQGVWSLIENDLDDCNPLSKGMLETKNTNKKKKITKKPPRDELNAEEAGFQQLAFSAVKEKTDINQTDLMLLESHVVYSISKEKTVSRFYLMRCTTPINEDVIQVPIKDAINSLHGPLVKKSFGSYIVTQAVEYFHLLPYAGIVSDWLSRKEFPNSSSLLQLGLGDVNMDCSPMEDNACTIEIKESSSDISNGTFQTAHVFDSKTSSTITETVNQKENDTNAFCRPGSMAEKDSSIACPPSTNVSKNISRIVQTNHLEGMMMSCEVDLNVFRSSSKDKVEMVDPVMKPCSTKSIGVKNASGNDSCNIGLANLNETPMKDLLALKGDEVLQTALRVLQKKRDDLSQQQRNLEDEIARCEKNLQTILSGDKDDLMLKMESIIEACNIACSRGATQTHCGTHLHLEKQWSPQSMKRRKLSEAILNLQNPCQELDAICNENNWILPRFNVFPLNGGYRASVTVQGFDFECPCGGDIRADPSEARESAATHMLRKLRSMASEAQ